MSRTKRGKGYANVGAVGQHGGSLPVYVCNACGREVVWADSKRTGRKYLVNVSTGQHGARYYRGDNVHPRNCAEIDVENATAVENYRAANRNAAHAMRTVRDAYADGKIDKDTFDSALATIVEMVDSL